MILDKENMFSLDQLVEVTGESENIVKLGAGDAGPSERISLFVNASAAFTGDGTLAVELQTAEDADFGTPVSVGVYTVGNEQLAGGGKLVAARLPHGCKKYLRLSYVVDGDLADGRITAGLAWDVQAETPDAITMNGV